MTTEDLPSSRNPTEWVTLPFVGVSLLIFLASLTQDGFFIDRSDNPRAWSSCGALLLLGWIGVLDGVWAWVANPLLVICWMTMCFRRLRFISICLSFASIGFSLSFLMENQILSNEAGNYSQITGYGLGYWLWVASVSIACLGSVVATVIDRLSQHR